MSPLCDVVCRLLPLTCLLPNCSVCCVAAVIGGFAAVNTPKGSDTAAAAFAQHTEEYSALLQAALRHSMQHSDHCSIACQATSIWRLLDSTADSTVLEAVSPGRQLPLLLVSLLKAFASLLEMPGGAASSEPNISAASIYQLVPWVVHGQSWQSWLTV